MKNNATASSRVEHVRRQFSHGRVFGAGLGAIVFLFSAFHFAGWITAGVNRGHGTCSMRNDAMLTS